MAEDHRIPVHEAPNSLAIFSKQDFEITVVPTGSELVIRNANTGAPSQMHLDGHASIWLGSPMAYAKASATGGDVMRVLVPAKLASRLNVSAMAQDCQVRLSGLEKAPLKLDDFLTYRSVVTGGHVALTGGDLQFVGFRREEAAKWACATTFKDATLTGAQVIQMHGDAHLDLSLPAGGTLEVRTAEDGAEPVVRGPEATNWTWHRSHEAITMPMAPLTGKTHGLI